MPFDASPFSILTKSSRYLPQSAEPSTGSSSTSPPHRKDVYKRQGGNGPIATIEAVKIFGATYDEATETADYSATDPRWDMSFFYGDVYVLSLIHIFIY